MMGHERFSELLRTRDYSESDQIDFVSWIRQYSRTVPKINGRLPVTPESVEDFLQPLRERAVSASQQLQAFRAVIAYRELVLRRHSPLLPDIAARLSRYAAQEQNARQAMMRSHGDFAEPMQAVA